MIYVHCCVSHSPDLSLESEIKRVWLERSDRYSELRNELGADTPESGDVLYRGLSPQQTQISGQGCQRITGLDRVQSLKKNSRFNSKR